MDLSLYGHVLWRHRKLLLGGVAAAVALAIFSYYRVDLGVPPSLTPRKAEVWQSQATVLITESGFPAGRRTIDLITKRVGNELVPVPEFNDPNRFASLASLYARLAMSDAVLRRMQRAGPVPGTFQASAALDASRRGNEPILLLAGQGETKAAAKQTVQRGLQAFIAYMRGQQAKAGIPVKKRVQLEVLNQPRSAQLVDPRKRTLPIVVFLAVLIAAIALAFVIENARRRPPALAEVESPPPPLVEVEPAPLVEVELRPEPEDEPEHERPAATVRRWA